MSGMPLPHVAADQQGGLPPVCGTGETDKAAGCRLLPFRQSAERSGLSTRLVFTVDTICGGPRHISREGRFLQCRYDMQQDAEDRLYGKSLPGGTDTVVSSSSVQPLTNVLS